MRGLEDNDASIGTNNWSGERYYAILQERDKISTLDNSFLDKSFLDNSLTRKQMDLSLIWRAAQGSR